MHLLYGNLYMGNGDYSHAIQSFKDARMKLGGRTEQAPPLIIKLVYALLCRNVL